MPAMQYAVGVPPALVRRGLLGRDFLVTRTLCSPGARQPREDRPEEEALRLPQRLAVQGRALGHRLQQRAAAKATAWWERYEEFVGLNEVREAQGNVAEVRRPGGGRPLTREAAGGSCRTGRQPHPGWPFPERIPLAGGGWGDWSALRVAGCAAPGDKLLTSGLATRSSGRQRYFPPGLRGVMRVACRVTAPRPRSHRVEWNLPLEAEAVGNFVP